MENLTQEQVEARKKRIRDAQQLRVTLDSKGWQEIIEPTITKMITDIIGFKREDGTWDTGRFGDKRIGEIKADRLLWYKQFGVDLINNINSYFQIAENARKDLEEKKEDKEDKIPMLESAYNVETPTTFEDKYSGGMIE